MTALATPGPSKTPALIRWSLPAFHRRRRDPRARGWAARRAARGAAAGALIGDVNHNDPGHGAAVGATAGALAGGVRSRRQHAAQAQNAQASQQAEMNTYWRAYDACMQGRGYTVQ